MSRAWRSRHADRWADYRLRRGNLTPQRERRLVRHVDAQRTVSGGRQEDARLRNGRATELETARCNSLSDRWRHRTHRDVESVRRNGKARLDRSEAPADVFRSSKWLRADRARV